MKNSSEINTLWKETLMGTLGMEFLYSTPDRKTFVASMPVTQKLCQPYGILHGGSVLALAESIAGYASMLLCKEDEKAFGQQISASHVHGGFLGDTLEATATAIHLGRTTHVWNVDVKNQEGILISTIRVTNFIKRPR